MSDERPIRIDISRAVGESLVQNLSAMGLVLVPESLARSAYELADWLEEHGPTDPGVSDSFDQACDRLVSQVAIARARKPGEQAT